MTFSRRQFLESAAMASLAAATGHAAEPGKIPTRKLGKTGARVSVLGMGGGSRFLSYKDEDKALEALNKAIDIGIHYIDTAQTYGNGVSETRVGKVMATRRKEVFLVTKIQERDPDKAMKRLEQSFKNLQTDRIDLVHIHSLTTAEDLAAGTPSQDARRQGHPLCGRHQPHGPDGAENRPRTPRLRLYADGAQRRARRHEKRQRRHGD
jgi:hypothetical protein